MTHDYEVSPFSSIDNLCDYLKRKPVDYGSIVDPSTQVLALGEVHTREITKQEIIDNLKRFKELGFTHLGLEAFRSDFQTELDEYQETGENEEAVVEDIQNSFGKYSPNTTMLYLQMLDQAKQIGIKTVAINMPRPMYESNQGHGLDAGSLRDQWMAEMVQRVIEDKNERKIVTFTGQYHVESSPRTMVGNLAQHGVKIVGVDFAGGAPSKRKACEIAASKIGASNERFMVKFNANAPYDWIIHLPQVEGETEIEVLMGMLSQQPIPLMNRFYV